MGSAIQAASPYTAVTTNPPSPFSAKPSLRQAPPVQQASAGYQGAYVAHSPIRINSNGDFDAAHGVTSGSGTALAPWIIENLDINGTGYGYSIYVGNTTDHFVVRNSYLHHAAGDSFDWAHFPDSGLVINNAVNGTASNNTFYANGWAGVYIRSSSKIEVDNNTAESTHYAIYLQSTDNTSVVHNYISNGNAGIWMYKSCNNNIIDNNTALSSAYFGLYLTTSSSGNAITYNTAGFARQYGFYVTGASGSALSHNNLKNNTHQAWDDGANTWDGNCWSDYNGTDLFHGPAQDIPGGDGIGDKPYNTATGQGIGGGNGVDSYPSMVPADFTPPVSTVNPIVPYWWNTIPITINVTATDMLSGVRDCTLRFRYSSDNGTTPWTGWATFQTDTSAPWRFTFNFPLGQGYYEFEANATDNAKNHEPQTGVAEASCAYGNFADEWRQSIGEILVQHSAVDNNGRRERPAEQHAQRDTVL